jgi:toxin ParE1/3/4
LEFDALAGMGRPGRDKGTRELIEYPYIIVYEIDGRQHSASVLAIVHGARDRGAAQEW